METSDITRGLHSRNPYDQYFAIIAVEELMRIDLLPHVIPLFRSRFRDVKITAIQAAGLLGLLEPVFYSEALLPLLRDPSSDIRYETATALGHLAHLNAFAALCRVAEDDPNAHVRKRAAKSARMVCGEIRAGDEEEDLRVVAFSPFRMAS